MLAQQVWAQLVDVPILESVTIKMARLRHAKNIFSVAFRVSRFARA
jgi:hypothetical protein